MSNNTQTERKWTSAQAAAINTRGRTLLVSAAAGSGKTATLTERIIRSITDKDTPADISKMLIVTFTRAAATELKERIFKALSDELAKNPADRHLNEQLIKLGSANICTIDSFYLNLIRQNFSALGISASGRVADTSELELLKSAAMDETIDILYDTDEGFPAFAECFVRTKSINRLSEPMLALYDDIASCPEGVEFIKNTADRLRADAQGERSFLETEYGKIICRDLISKFEYFLTVLNDAFEHSEGNADTFGKRSAAYAYDAEFCNNALGLLRDDSVHYDTLRELFLAYNPLKMGAVKGADENEQSLFYKTERGKIKDDIRDICAELFSRDNREICAEMLLTAQNADILYALLKDFSARFSEEKSRRGIMDFDDIKRYTLKLLVAPDGSPTAIAKDYAEQFTDIYIDEYQDVDLIQDRIFSAISKNNRFMVGDIKQSIYGFRGAEPQVFAAYRESFTPYSPEANDGADGMTVFMSENFRCDKPIIDFTNLVCSRIFNASKESIGYSEEDDLRFSKLTAEGYISPKPEVAVILTGKNIEAEDEAEGKKRKKKKTDAPEKEELEAEYIAEKISGLIGKERLASGELIAPGDVAVLYRSNKMVSYLAEALGKRGILCSEGGGDSYFESPDVLLVLSILNVVDNPHRDIHLAGALCSPLFEFTLDDLIIIRKNASSAYSLYDALVEYKSADSPLGEKCRHFDDILDELRTSAASLPVDRFLRLLFETDIFVSSGLLSDRDDFGEGGNLLRLYDYARTFEAGSFKGLYNFIEFINSLIENGKMLEVAPKDRCRERVTLTTMHHSKGLEFPVCFICGTGAKKNTKLLSSSLLYEYPTGVAMKLSDETGFARINTPLREAIEKRKFLSEIEEEMRILYVAMTRARERLYITATKNSSAEEIMSEAKMRAVYSYTYILRRCSSFIDWVLIPFFDSACDTDFCELRFVSPSEYNENIGEAVSQNCTAVSRPEPDRRLLDTLREKFSFKYGYTHLRKIPAKLSVSRLSPDILDENDTSAELSATEKKTAVPDFFITGKTNSATSAERGTATHLFFQFCDFSLAKEKGIGEEIARLIEKRFIPENIASLIYTDELESFLDSELCLRMFSASEIICERRFNLLLPADAFSESDKNRELLQGEALAVQGVIDLILINGNGEIELYDYKTDRLTREELADDAAARQRMNAAHGLQLSYYAHAVEMLFEKKCSRVCVYSTHSAKLYDIDRIPLRLAEIE